MTTFALVFAIALGYLALVAAYCALRSLYRLRRAVAVLGRGAQGRESMLEAIERHVLYTERLAAQVEQVRTQVEQKQEETARQAELFQQQLVERLDTQQSQIRQQLDSEQGQLAGTVTDFGSALARSLRNVAMVRFDAFDDMSGRMSFALALLDDAGDGVTLTSIAGHADSRLYAKGISGGAGEHELSPEEQQAVTAALSRRAKSTHDENGKRRRSGQSKRSELRDAS